MREIQIDYCPYCNSRHFAKGYQSDRAGMYKGKLGIVLGSIIEHLICKDCGSIVHSKVLNPEIFKDL